MDYRPDLMEKDTMRHFKKLDEARRKYPDSGTILDDYYRPQWYYSAASGKNIEIRRPEVPRG